MSTTPNSSIHLLSLFQHKDVAIITLETPVPDNLPNIRPVCLASGHQTYEGETATVIGWGSLKENGPQPNTLQVQGIRRLKVI